MVSDIADWPTGPVRISWREDNDANLPVTGAHGFCFHDHSVLVCSIRGRGATIPGGHVDDGETPEACFVREVFEEACVEIHELSLLGYVEADHSQVDNYKGPYPLRSVQAMYRAAVRRIETFAPQHEADARQFVCVDELPAVHHEWNSVLQAALDAAVHGKD